MLPSSTAEATRDAEATQRGQEERDTVGSDEAGGSHGRRVEQAGGVARTSTGKRRKKHRHWHRVSLPTRLLKDCSCPPPWCEEEAERLRRRQGEGRSGGGMASEGRAGDTGPG